MNLLLYILTFTITIILLWRNQKQTSYIRTGWFFNLLTFLYYGFPLIYLQFDPEYGIDFLYRYFNLEFIEYFTSVVLVCQLSFLFGELFTSKAKNNKGFTANIKIIDNKIIYVLMLFGYVLFFSRWQSVGGFSTILQLNRGDYINEAASSGVFSRYDIFFNVVSLFIAINLSLVKNYIKKNKLIFGSYLLFLLLTILMGTRLILVNYIIGFVCVVFLLNRNLFTESKKKIAIFSFLLIMFLILYQTVRVDVVRYFATNDFEITQENVSFVPAEFFTGILAEHSLKEGMLHITEFSYFKRLVPNSIASFIGMDDYEGYAVVIANNSKFSSGNVIFTIPYAFDVYHGVGDSLTLLFIISLILYLVFQYITSYFSYSNILYLLSFYFLIYNVFRAEGPIWFSKIYLTFFLLALVNLFWKFKQNKF